MPCREAVGMVFLWPCPRARQCLQMSVSVGVSADMCAVSTCVPVRGCGNFDVAVFRAASGSCGSREYPYAMRVLCVSAAVRMGRVGSGVAVSACPPTSACVNKCLSKETDATGSLLELCCLLSRKVKPRRTVPALALHVVSACRYYVQSSSVLVASSVAEAVDASVHYLL